jgi:hypothetical protein
VRRLCAALTLAVVAGLLAVLVPGSASAAPVGGIGCLNSAYTNDGQLSATVSEIYCLQTTINGAYPPKVNNSAGQSVAVPVLYKVCTQAWSATAPVGCGAVYRLGSKMFTSNLSLVTFDPDRPQDYQGVGQSTTTTVTTTAPPTTTTETSTAPGTTTTTTATATIAVMPGEVAIAGDQFQVIEAGAALLVFLSAAGFIASFRHGKH